MTETAATTFFAKKEKVQLGSAIMGIVCIFGGFSAIAKGWAANAYPTENMDWASAGFALFGLILVLGGIFLLILPIINYWEWKHKKNSPLLSLHAEGITDHITDKLYKWEKHWEDVAVFEKNHQLHLLFSSEGKQQLRIIIDGEPEKQCMEIVEGIKTFLLEQKQ